MAIKNNYEAFIEDMIKTGVSTEDIASHFTNALNAYSEKARKAEKEAKKMADAVALVQMVSAFLTTHYDEEPWDKNTIDAAAKDIVKSFDAMSEIVPIFEDILKPKAEPKGNVKDGFIEAEKFFNDLLASLK